ncbi:MAG: UDP-4-amino-4,6-dideoxy-N-acetyl-beta-L-altrosamine transaminase [Phycisphaerales bacterium]|nr:UDP-4-amino-4,6-dideoxy-N-acetyl-beta-L-altrosamine transaminase [Phycisphaerales bacterium]
MQTTRAKLEVGGQLAIDGGKPVRSSLLPYGRQTIAEDDIAAVVRVLRSDWLTTGPAVTEFEQAFAAVTGAESAVSVSSGTAALHAMMHALRIGPGDEVIVPTMTFAGTANAVRFAGGQPVFADVDAATLLIDPDSVAARIGPRTRAIVAVDYAGQPCDYDALSDIAQDKGLALLSDACHSLGASYRGNPVGCLTAMTVFSFHPVKAITTAEGGMVTVSDNGLADRLRAFRNHCMNADHQIRAANGTWAYEIAELGWNYRLNDMQCALGLSQLGKLPEFIGKRQALAGRYDELLADVPGVTPLAVLAERTHAYHLYVVQLDLDALTVDRGAVFAALRAEGIGVNVHYLPVHRQPLYRDARGSCPVAEAAYERMLSLPIFPTMTMTDVEDVVTALRKVLYAYRR